MEKENENKKNRESISELKSNYKYIIGLLTFFSIYIFGTSTVLTTVLGYFSYHYGNKNVLTSFVFMMSWFLFGFGNTISYLFMTLIYESIFRKEKISSLISKLKNVCNGLNADCLCKLTISSESLANATHKELVALSDTIDVICLFELYSIRFTIIYSHENIKFFL